MASVSAATDTGRSVDVGTLYKERFENIFRVVKRLTSSLDIGEILEMIRDEAKSIVPSAREACLLLFDPDAARYTRPLHCSIHRDRINCQFCKRARDAVQHALIEPMAFQCRLDDGTGISLKANGFREKICEIALPIHDEEKPLAVLDVIVEDGHTLSEKDFILLTDLSELATNLIINARSHWKMSEEKLTLDLILGHLRPFVPDTVRRIVEKNPEAPTLQKRDIDVSILFLDVAGYTKISEALTREKVNFIIEKYFSSFLDIINSNGGDINETAGDGLMVIFQGAKKMNALRAAHAALEVRKKTEEINRELQGRFNPISINMGVNSGEASVGMTHFQGVTGSRTTFTATGPATNLAARLAGAAKNGDILIGPETARRVETSIPLYDRGLKKLKNVSERTHMYSLIASSEDEKPVHTTADV